MRVAPHCDGDEPIGKERGLGQIGQALQVCDGWWRLASDGREICERREVFYGGHGRLVRKFSSRRPNSGSNCVAENSAKFYGRASIVAAAGAGFGFVVVVNDGPIAPRNAWLGLQMVW